MHDAPLLKSVPVELEAIYVPSKLRKELDPAKAEALAEDILENGLQSPIQVRRDKDRYVLVTGLHRLEAARILGEKTIGALIVAARQH
jgi:ParB-like chromosome segregation protein Spo0J